MFEVFARPLVKAKKMLMCMDKFRQCCYTERIWCVFEVFSAVRNDIKITLIMPELSLDQEIDTVQELRDACKVNVQLAEASKKADEDRIKSHIIQQLGTYDRVNQTVEQALWIECIKKLSGEEPRREEITQKMRSSESSDRTSEEDLRTRSARHCILQ